MKLALVGPRLDAVATPARLRPVAGPLDVEPTVLGRAGGQGGHFGLVDGGTDVGGVDAGWLGGVVRVELLGCDLGVSRVWDSCGRGCHGESQDGEHGSNGELHIGGGG